MKTILNTIEAVYFAERAGVEVTTSRVSKAVGQSFARTKKQLIELTERGIVVRSDFIYRSNVRTSVYRLSDRGLLILAPLRDAFKVRLPF